MPETEEQRDIRELKELEGKNIAHYTVMLSAWVQTRMERDKTLVTLSAAAIGLLITILTTVGVSSYKLIIIVLLSFLGFITCIVSALIIYQLNADHIEKEIRKESTNTLKLKKFDKLSFWSFTIGASTLTIFGLLSAYQFLSTNEKNMTLNKAKVVTPAISKKSIGGIGALKPQDSSDSSLGSQSSQSTSRSGNNENKSKG